MLCENCRCDVDERLTRRFFDDAVVCYHCYRELMDLTRETGGELETLSEIRFEQYVDSITAVVA